MADSEVIRAARATLRERLLELATAVEGMDAPLKEVTRFWHDRYIGVVPNAANEIEPASLMSDLDKIAAMFEGLAARISAVRI